MILEEINGTVVATVVRETGGVVELKVGDYFSDHERSSLSVVGSGKVTVRVDDNCTLEFRGVEVATEEVQEAVVEAIPETVAVVVADTVAATEAPVIIQPVKAAKA
jgi:urease accessory protein UreE